MLIPCHTTKLRSYCWWLKSCTTWNVWDPINNRDLHIFTIAGFQPSMNRMTGMTHPNTQDILDSLNLEKGIPGLTVTHVRQLGTAGGCCPKVSSNDPFNLGESGIKMSWNAPPTKKKQKKHGHQTSRIPVSWKEIWNSFSRRSFVSISSSVVDAVSYTELILVLF